MALTCKGKINLRENKVYDKCSNTCDFTYSYKTTPSSCRIQSKGYGNNNKSQYLNLKCFDGNNDINYSSLGNIEINEVRLYCPSLNKWNGKRTEAELVLQHVGNGKQVYVCIPIMTGGKNGVSVDWFKKLQLKTLSVKRHSESNPTSPNFKLDDVIPNGSYYVMKKNGLKFSNCVPANNIMILFSSENPAYIGRNELELLRQRVSTSSAGHHIADTGEIIYNEKGTKGNGKGAGYGAGGDGSVMESECYQITDEDGNPITDDEGKDWKGVSPDWVKNLWKNTDLEVWKWKVLMFVYTYYYIFMWVPTLLLLYIMYKFKVPIRIARFMQGLFEKKSSSKTNESSKKTDENKSGTKIDVLDQFKKK